MAGQTLEALRKATHSQHEALESRLDIFGRIASAAGRRALVEGFHRLHAGVEAAAGGWVADLPGLDFAARRRTAQLAVDLSALGVTGGVGQGAPVAPSVGAALGLLYVAEGSSLGGRIIRRRATAAGIDLTGMSFLDPYGEAVGERWRSFVEVLERETATPELRSDAVAGGVAGFRFAAACLSLEALAGS